MTAPRRSGRRDTTHAAVRDGLRELGWSVWDTGGVGDGFPDLVVGIGNGTQWPMPPPPNARGVVCDGENYFVEVKSPGGTLEDSQQEFAWRWRGNYIAAETAQEAADAIQALRAARPKGRGR